MFSRKRENKFYFDKELCIDEEKVILFFKVIDLLIEFGCTFGKKTLCIDEEDDNLCDKCEDLKTIEYYYNTKKLIFYHYSDFYHDFKINKMFRQIYLTKYRFNLGNVIDDCAITYLGNVQIVIPNILDSKFNNFNSNNDFIITVDDYFACIKMLQKNGIAININHIRPKIQHILDNISINKIISNK